jgi:electron transport complex protein RnfE
MERFLRDLVRGIFEQNALTKSLIGLCSVLAVSTKMENGIMLGIAATFVLVFSEIIISLFRKWIPSQIRIPIFIVVIASFVTVVDLTMQAFSPEMYRTLGIWIPLIVVNCMILGRVEVFASREPVIYSIADALGTGMGYTLVLVIMGFVRELLGTGKLVAFGANLIVLPPAFQAEAPKIFIMFPGAFLTFAFLIVLSNYLLALKEKR